MNLRGSVSQADTGKIQRRREGGYTQYSYMKFSENSKLILKVVLILGMVACT